MYYLYLCITFVFKVINKKFIEAYDYTGYGQNPQAVRRLICSIYHFGSNYLIAHLAEISEELIVWESSQCVKNTQS